MKFKNETVARHSTRINSITFFGKKEPLIGCVLLCVAGLLRRFTFKIIYLLHSGLGMGLGLCVLRPSHLCIIISLPLVYMVSVVRTACNRKWARVDCLCAAPMIHLTNWIDFVFGEIFPHIVSLSLSSLFLSFFSPSASPSFSSRPFAYPSHSFCRQSVAVVRSDKLVNNAPSHYANSDPNDRFSWCQLVANFHYFIFAQT